jgi:DNA polymerase III delta subunit
MTLWKLKDVSQRTRNHQEIAKAVGVNQYFLPEYLGAAGMYSLEEIEDTLRILCDLDESLKSSSSDSEILVHSALIAILRKRT